MLEKGVKNMKNELKAEKLETISWTPLEVARKLNHSLGRRRKKVFCYLSFLINFAYGK